MGIQQLIQQLATPDQEARDRARAALVSAGSEAVPALVEALGHGERDIRAGAALTLGAMRASEAAGALAAMANSDPDASARPLALRALADLAHPGCPAAVTRTLLQKLADPDMFARALACTGLGRIGDEPSRKALKLALKDGEDWVRQAARAALASAPAAPAGATPQGPGTALMTRPAGGELAAPSPADALLGRLASLDLKAQREAQEALQALGTTAIPRIAPLLTDPLPHVRRAAAEVLGAIGAAEGLAPLLDLLAEPGATNDLRAMALHAVASILLGAGPEAATPELLDLLRRHIEADDTFVRAAAAAALIAGSPLDRRPVMEHLHDEDEEWVRVVAARALRQAAGPPDRPLLPLLLDELAQMTDPTGQRYLLGALQRILADPEPQDSDAVVGPVSFFLESEDASVRRAAVRLLVDLVRRPDSKLLRDFQSLLEENPSDVSLIAALGRLAPAGDAAVVPVLRRALASAGEEAATAAARALASIGGRAAIDALVEVANAQAGRATALAAQALAGVDPASEVIAARIPDGRWERRVQLRCSCGGQLRFVEREGREELRCPACDREYALTAAEKLFPADRTPFGLCVCPGCRRKQLLIRQDDSERLVCPSSGLVHVRPFDHPRQLRLISDLPLGACTCCAEPQPLIRVDDEVRCYRTRQLYRAAARGFEPASEAVPAAAEDVAAINRALLLGTLGIAESGLVASDVPDPGEDPDRER